MSEDTKQELHVITTGTLVTAMLSQAVGRRFILVFDRRSGKAKLMVYSEDGDHINAQ